MARGQKRVGRKMSSTSPFHRGQIPSHFNRFSHSCLRELPRSLCGVLSVVVQLGRLNFLRTPKTNLAEQVAQSSSPGDTSGARQRGLRQDRPASDEEEPVPSTSGFPGSSKADLPMTWQLRGVSIHKLGGNELSRWGLFGQGDSTREAILCPETIRPSQCQALDMADKALEFTNSCTAEPQFPDSVGHFPGSPHTEAAGTGTLPQCATPCSIPEINYLGKTVCSISSYGTS